MHNLYSYYSADRAVDGLKSDLSFSGGQCAASENSQTAKLDVDPGEILCVQHILIQYATRNRMWSTYLFVDLILFYDSMLGRNYSIYQILVLRISFSRRKLSG